MNDRVNEKFWLHAYAPGPSGLENGQGTIDEAYLEYRSAEAPWSVRVGRFQAAWGLDDVMKKSLDQNDSPSFDITWTDGAWLQWQLSDDWTTHVIVRHNDRQGPTGTLRADRYALAPPQGNRSARYRRRGPPRLRHLPARHPAFLRAGCRYWLANDLLRRTQVLLAL